MALPVLTVESFTFNAPPSLDGKLPLKMAAKRYTDGRQSEDGLTVLLAHGLGARESYSEAFSTKMLIECADMQDKEHWEPMLCTLFEIQSIKSPPHRIREAWAFDWQTHGDSAVLNSDALKTRPDGVCELTF
jgi:hypothetical protein